MTKRKTLSVLLVLAILFSAMSFSAHAVGTSAEAAHLEDLAIAYVEDYVDTIYFYDSPNLTAGTLKEYYNISENLTATQMSTTLSTETVELCGTAQTAAELCESLSVFAATADYLKYIRSEQNITRTDFNMDVSIIRTYIDSNSAYVHLYTYITYYYTGDPEQVAAGDNYIVYFTKLGNDWIIADVYAEEVESYCFNDILTTIDAKKNAFDTWLQSEQAVSTENEGISLSNHSAGVEVDPHAITTAYDRTYDRADAIAYAYTYTTSTYTESQGNDPAFLNGYFPNFGANGYGGNCQNFVSQCIWAGFGGNDTPDALYSNQFPMNPSWFCQQNGNKSMSWATVDYFRDYIDSTGAYAYTSPDLIAEHNIINVSENASFNGYTLTQLNGSILHVGETLGHAIIITTASGTAFSSIKYCGNSPMRKAQTLNESAYISNNMRLIIPEKMKYGRTCGGGGVHTFSGSSCKCTKSGCDFSKLNVTGTLLQPFAVNTTRTITGNANATCYRMAMGITTPSGTTTWYEVMSTSTITRSYQFTETGLYIITISGRDISPDNANSVADTHIYKIRVY